MSPNKRIVEYHLARLQDKNPEVRLRSIKELEMLEAPEALDALQNLFQNDPVLQVRKAAQQAGRAIFLSQQSQRQQP